MNNLTKLEQDKINDAIVNHLSILWTSESIDKIKGLFGDETLLSIQTIASGAGSDIIWANDDDLFAHKTTVNNIKEKYPFLSHAAITKIADASAYFWK